MRQRHIQAQYPSRRPIRPVHVVAPRAVFQRKSNDIVYVRSTETLEHYPSRFTDPPERLGTEGAQSRFPGATTAKWRMGKHHICLHVAPCTAACGGTSQTGLVADNADNDSLREQHRARPASIGRDARWNSLCTDRTFLFTVGTRIWSTGARVAEPRSRYGLCRRRE